MDNNCVMDIQRRLDLFPKLPDMLAELRRLLAQLAPGQVATCGQIATALGDRKAARWVGFWLKNHRHTPDCSCHRVIYAGGLLGGSSGFTPQEQARQLAAEGVPLQGGIVAIDQLAPVHFASSHPLVALQEFQDQVSAHTHLARPRGRPRWIAGLDLSYGRKAGSQPDGETWAIAALVMVDARSGKTVATHMVRHLVTFPYITSYLSFREIPAMLAAIEAAEQAGDRAETILVDGAGILHPRRAGIAAMLGAVSGYPTIGVAKSHLCGSYDEALLAAERIAPVEWAGELSGVAMLTRQTSPKPLFVSPGNRHSVGSAAVIVRGLLSTDYLPTPVAIADRLSRQLARAEEKSQDSADPLDE